MARSRRGNNQNNGVNPILSPPAEGEGNDDDGDRRDRRPRRKSQLNLDETLAVFFSKGSPVVDVVAVLSLFVNVRQGKLPVPVWKATLYLASCLLAFCVHVVGVCGFACLKPVRRRGPIACASIFLRMLSAACLLLLLLLLDSGVAVLWLVLLLLPLVLVIALSLMAFCSPVRPGLNWGPFKEDLKVHFVLSSNVVNMAFGGLSGGLLGYPAVSAAAAVAAASPSSSFHQPSNNSNSYNKQQQQRQVMSSVAPAFLLFYAAALGLLVELLCTVPPRIPDLAWRERTARVFTPFAAYASLLCLVLASVLAAEDIRRTYVSWGFFAVVFVVALVACILFLRTADDRNNHHSRTDDEQERSFSDYLLNGLFTPLLSLVMGTHSMHSIRQGGTGDTAASSPINDGIGGLLFTCLLHCGQCSIIVYAVRSMVFAHGRAPQWAKRCSTIATYLAVGATCLVYAIAWSLKYTQLGHDAFFLP